MARVMESQIGSLILDGELLIDSLKIDCFIILKVKKPVYANIQIQVLEQGSKSLLYF